MNVVEDGTVIVSREKNEIKRISMVHPTNVYNAINMGYGWR